MLRISTMAWIRPVLLMALAGLVQAAGAQPSRLARYKAVFIYNFIEFVSSRAFLQRLKK